MKFFVLLTVITASLSTNSFSQISQTIGFDSAVLNSTNYSSGSTEFGNDPKNLFSKKSFARQLHYKNTLSSIRRDKASSEASILPVAIGVWSFLYLLNPIILFENDKIALGFTKEISVGFGNFGEHRASFEYSYIFRKDLNSIIRFGYKYDILTKAGLTPSNEIQGTPVLSVGGGYFNNFSRPGYFAETSYGYSLRNDKILIYPSAKLRFTYVAQGSNIFDFSFGLMIGIANPFIDLKIRRSPPVNKDQAGRMF